MFTPDDLRDGVLTDVTERAQEAGFRIPVAVTAATLADVFEWPKTEPAIQDEVRTRNGGTDPACAATTERWARLEPASAFSVHALGQPEL